MSFKAFLIEHHITVPLNYFESWENCTTGDYSCFWEAIKDELQLNFSYQDLVTNVVPFLDAHTIPINELIAAKVTLCASDNNFGDCYITSLTSDQPEILETLHYGEDVWYDVYARCADIIFSEPYFDAGVEYRTAQINIYSIILAIGCIPQIPEAEGIMQTIDVSVKAEAKLPNYLFSGPFGYGEQQTKVAQLITSAIHESRELAFAGINCDNAISKKGTLLSLYKNIITDPQRQEEIWGPAANNVTIRDQFFEFPPNNYTHVESKPSLFESATECN